jgi:chorismate dehydratase
MLRIGEIEYANCTPIFHALREQFPCENYQFIRGVPAQLNAMLAAGTIDVCPSSSIAFAHHPDRYLIIPGLSISSCGPVQSVLLFSAVPIEELNGSDILLTSESATSVNLLKIILKKQYGCENIFRTTSLALNDAMSVAPATLLIGDTALKASQSLHGLFVYDLGDLWYSWTGTPFVFALWFASKQAFASLASELCVLAGQLQRSKVYAMENLESIVEASPDVSWMGRDALLSYWRTNLSYDLSKDHCNGLKLFYRLSAELGLIETAPELAFLELK